MGKVVEKAKAAVKKVATKKVEVKVTKCEECRGTGLLDAHNLCTICDGSGQVTV